MPKNLISVVALFAAAVSLPAAAGAETSIPPAKITQVLMSFDQEFPMIAGKVALADVPMTPTERELFRSVQGLIEQSRLHRLDNSEIDPAPSRRSIISLKIGKAGGVLINFRPEMRACMWPEDDTSYCNTLDASVDEIVDRRLPRGPFPSGDPRAHMGRNVYFVFDGRPVQAR